MREIIKIANNLKIKLPLNMVAELSMVNLGYIIYFKGKHIYIPENASLLLAQEKIKDLAFAYFKNAKKVTDYLINSN